MNDSLPTKSAPYWALQPLLKQLRWLSKHENILLSLAAVLVGVLGGIVAVGFRHTITLVRNGVLFQQFGQLRDLSSDHHVWGLGVILVLAAGGLVVGLLSRYLFSGAEGHGVPEVMEACLVRGGRMKLRAILGKSLATIVCLGSGGSAGREGPTVHIGAGIGSVLAQALRLRPELIKILLGCGAAAGIAASFNTPIAAVLFALELVLLEFKTRSFIPLVISAVFATMISRWALGDLPAFIVPNYDLVSHFEIVNYLVLGLCAGGVAILFIVLNYRSEAYFQKLQVPKVVKPAIGGAFVGLIAVYLPEVLGGGHEWVSKVLFGEIGLFMCCLLIVGKTLAVALTLGSGGSGGVFAPSLFVGAMLGGAIGHICHAIAPESTAGPGAYALVGMAAVFSGVSRATLTSIIILFEMTLSYNIILPLMFSCVISDAIAWSFYQDSVYTKKLRSRGIPIMQDMGPDVMALHTVREVMNPQVVTVAQGMSMRQVWEQILKSGHQGFPIVSSKSTLCGIITATDIRKAISEDRLDESVDQYCSKNVVTVTPDATLDQLLAILADHSFGHIPVVETDDPLRLVGIVTRSDIMKIGSGRLDTP